MIRAAREQWLWTNWLVAALGVWLATAPFTFGYADDGPMAWNDVVSGFLLAVFALIGLRPTVRGDFCGRWGACFVGIWLQFAPLLLWAKEPAAYLGDTMVGAFAIGLMVLVPMMPGHAHHMAMMKPGPEIPPGWTYNPSSWLQRAPLIALGIAGWFVSRYLAAVQLGYIAPGTPGFAWEPFFGDGTARVLHSDVSQMWPISDAGLGAAAYTFEALMGFMGATTRWRTMPWMVAFFGILVIPLGVTHIVLVILQPVVVGEWCTLCLVAAALMLIMIPLTVDEVVAMVQFMMLARWEGKPLWRTFWVGDTIAGGGPDDRTPGYGSKVAPMAGAMVWGISVPLTLLLSIGLGVWLMFAPAVFGTEGFAADSDHLVGALVLTIAAIATAEVVRPLRFANMLLALWLIGAPWFLEGGEPGNPGARWNDLVIGVALLAASIPRGRIRETYGAWDRSIR